MSFYVDPSADVFETELQVPAYVKKRELQPVVHDSSVYLFQSWGCRSPNHPGRAHERQKLQAYYKRRGKVALPPSAASVDPTTRPPSERSQGSWTLTPPYNRCYGYYKSYGTCKGHNYPCGSVPSPRRVYSTGTDWPLSPA
ncbi:hypothetical protein DIPPA_16704 [Diplonema papillatum]|nr:hypothetical protein DIPPA_16704 [Diplonema papillatum]